MNDDGKGQTSPGSGPESGAIGVTRPGVMGDSRDGEGGGGRGDKAGASKGIAALLYDEDALGLASLVRSGQVSSAELLHAAIEQAETLNPRFNFLARDHYEFARSAIANGLPNGPLTGVPWLLKDLNTYVAGEVTGQGSRFYVDDRAAVTSEIVRRYQAAGLVIFGKTATPEFGLSATTEPLVGGATRNPWNPERSAGGSSGGAAAAVAAGVLPAAHATDGGGSIRMPASCCGLFGLKPSRGRTPMGPLLTEGWGGLSTHHAVTRSVRDSAALLDAVQGPEPGSRYAAPTPPRPYLEEIGRRPRGLRIALMTAPTAGTPVDEECLAAVRATARLCESLGHHVEEAAPALDGEALARYAGVLPAASLCEELDLRAQLTGIPVSLDVVEPVTMGFYELGKSIVATDWVKANNLFQRAAVEVARFMQDYDLLLSPTLGSPPLRLGVLAPAPESFEAFFSAIMSYTAFTSLANQTGQPSMSVPLGMSKAGLPIGSMFAARYGDEAMLLRLAAQLEEAAPWAGRRPIDSCSSSGRKSASSTTGKGF